MRTVQQAELNINFKIRANEVSNTAAEIFSELVYAFREKVAIQRQNRVIAAAPPTEELIASGTRQRSG